MTGEMPTDFSGKLCQEAANALIREYLPVASVVAEAPERFQPALRQWARAYLESVEKRSQP